MSDNKSLRKNFLKTQIFNFEQNLKSAASDHVGNIDRSLEEIRTIERRLKELPDFTDKENVRFNLQKYRLILMTIRNNQVDLFNYIDYYYKFGSSPVAEFISNEKPLKKKSRVIKKKTKTE